MGARDREAGDTAQSGGADQPAVRPTIRVELPDPGIGLVASLGDRIGRGLDRTPPVGVEPVLRRGRGEGEQRLPERVELELGAGMVAGDVLAAGIPVQPELTLIRDRPARDRVRRGELRSMLEQPGGEEACGAVEQHRVARARGGLARDRLITHPRVAVIV